MTYRLLSNHVKNTNLSKNDELVIAVLWPLVSVIHSVELIREKIHGDKK